MIKIKASHGVTTRRERRNKHKNQIELNINKESTNDEEKEHFFRRKRRYYGKERRQRKINE